MNWKKREIDIAEKVAAILSQLTTEEKVALCHAGTKFASNGVERLNIPNFIMTDGPHGVRQEIEDHSWDPKECDTDFTTYLPTGTAMGATWNPELGYRFGKVLGSETRARGKDVILGPGFNIIRDPRCGRNFEYYSEDPYLIAKMVPGVIQGIQEQDVAACAKHFALNSQELNRNFVDATPDDRTLREIYLPGFEAAVKEGEVMTVMGAYNKYHGQWCCHNKKLLMDILKTEWQFEGAVISDWNGCHIAEEAAIYGLDIEMGTAVEKYDDYHLANPLLEAVKSGQVPMADLDDKAKRIIRTFILIGILDENRLEGAQHPPAHCEEARLIGEEAPVLLQNNGILPLDSSKLKTIAVIGENATATMASGGGSSGVKAFYEVTPLEGLKNKLGDGVEIIYAKAYPDSSFSYSQIPTDVLNTVDIGSGVKGWRVEWGNSGVPEGEIFAVENREKVDLQMEAREIHLEGQKRHWWKTKWHAKLTAPETGKYTFALRGDSSATLYINNEKVVSFSNNFEMQTFTAEVELTKNEFYDLQIEYKHDDGITNLQLGWSLPGETVIAAETIKKEAIEAAKKADVVLFFGGLNHFYDAEGVDKPDLTLPGGQNELIEELSKINSNLVVTMIAGSPVEMPWSDKVPAILLGWYPGMEAGNIFADIISGNLNPSGKLPCTFPKRLAHTPGEMLNDYDKDICKYKEGIFTGYRWYDKQDIEPLFPFGHGLSYTEFTYSDIKIDGMAITCTITNTGNREGKEVAQLYLQDVEASVERPIRELKGFRKVNLKPAESRTVSFTLTKRDLSFWDVETNTWKAEAGLFKVFIGTSSRDLHLEGEFTYAE